MSAKEAEFLIFRIVINTKGGVKRTKAPFFAQHLSPLSLANCNKKSLYFITGASLSCLHSFRLREILTSSPNGLSKDALLRPKQEHRPIPVREVLLSKYVLNRHGGNLSKVIFLDFAGF